MHLCFVCPHSNVRGDREILLFTQGSFFFFFGEKDEALSLSLYFDMIPEEYCWMHGIGRWECLNG
jgi:hypothetical protein